MKRVATGTLFALTALVLASTLGACDDSALPGHGNLQTATSCTEMRSCDTCTPVAGCGWCFNGTGSGTCVADPDQCSGAQFSWTWEPSGCRVNADASTIDPDAGALDASHDGSPEAQ
jgi:hypothetical protein